MWRCVAITKEDRVRQTRICKLPTYWQERNKSGNFAHTKKGKGGGRDSSWVAGLFFQAYCIFRGRGGGVNV